MITGFRRCVNAGSFKVLVGSICVSTTIAICTSETTKLSVGLFHSLRQASTESLSVASKVFTGNPSFLRLDFAVFSWDKIVSVSHCHEAGDSCKEPTQHDSMSRSTTETGKGDVENRVVELSSQSFDETVLKNDKDVFVVFYAPWCGYCKRLFPVWEELAQQEHSAASSVVVSQIDMTQHQIHVPGVVVRGYPTIYLFKKGHKGTPIEYRGGRDVVSFSAFLKYYTNI